MKALLHALRCRPTLRRDAVLLAALAWEDEATGPYRSPRRLLEDAARLWGWATDVRPALQCCDRRAYLRRDAVAGALEHFRARMDLEPGRTPFTALCRDAGLSALGRDLLLVLALVEAGLWEGGRIHTLADLLDEVAPAGLDGVDVPRTAGPQGELECAGLLELERGEVGEGLRLRLAAEVTSALLADDRGRSRLPQSEEQVVRGCGALFRAAYRFSTSGAAVSGATGRVAGRGRSVLPPAVAGLAEPLLAAVRRNKSWALCERLASCSPQEQCAVLLAVGHAAGGIVRRESELLAGLDGPVPLTGRLLLQALYPGDADREAALRLLGPGSRLRQRGLLREAHARVGAEVGDYAALVGAEFELPASLRRELGLPLCADSGVARLVEPRLTLAHLVLPDETERGLREAVVQHQERDTLMGAWGLGALAPYGNGVTLLFHGEPGTGKTAAAEALASELAVPLLVLDFAQVQSKWVGDTEKNLERAFREAEDLGAVLFLDEVDSLLAPRADAHRNWEVTQVNVLLGLLEAHRGVVAMATNRADALDDALARRLSARLAFPRPDAALSARLWQRLIPADYPLAGKPDFEALGRLCLTGAEIKNTLFAAARQTLASPRRRKVQVNDLVFNGRTIATAERELLGFSRSV